MKTRLGFSLDLALRFALVFSLLAAEAVSLRSTTWPATFPIGSAEPKDRRANPAANLPKELFVPRSHKMRRVRASNDKTSLSSPGQSATLLPDGRWLIIGGEGPDGPLATAAIRDPRSGTVTSLTNGLQQPRAWHTATLLPDGTVLVLGGIGANGRVVDAAELFDLETQKFESLPLIGLSSRAYHTATLLTEGRVLVAGGLSPTGETLGKLDLWDARTKGMAAPAAELLTPRRKHTASLLRDGTVLFWGGADRNGEELDYGEIYDPETQRLRMETVPAQASADPPRLEASLPEDRAENVPLDTLIALRFSKSLRVDTVNANSMTLHEPEGVVAAKVIPAEAGMLAFLTPKAPLLPGTTYTLSLIGLSDATGLPLPDSSVTFTTAGKGAVDEVWTPGAGGWTTGLPDSPWQKLPPLQAPADVTALAGQALKLNGDPLAHVTLQIGGNSARTDHTGRFLLKPLSSGHQVMLIDGRTASNPGRTYGIFEVGVDVAAGRTNALSYTIWMPLIDTAHAVTIPSPTLGEVVVTTPLIPGLELRIPPQTVIRDHEAQVVTQVSITPIPLDRPPFPLAKGVDVPIYFTIQPGAAYLQNPNRVGARLIYPNLRNARPGTRFDFWNYDPDEKGWHVYGQGTVTPQGRQIVPDPGAVIYEFTGAMVAPPGLAPQKGPPPGGKKGGDPVDLATGLFVLESTDLYLTDIIPIDLTRTYRHSDSRSRAFGIGTTHRYDIFLVGDTFPWTYQELILPDGGRIHYNRTSPGISWTDAVYQHTSSPTAFYGSTISWNGNGWTLKLKNGTTYTFPEAIGASRPQKAALLSIRDRYGNTVSVARDSTYGNITQISSPSGRWISFTYDPNDLDHNRIVMASDNIGRQVGYQYDTSGRLWKVTDANRGITEFGYDGTSDRMTTIKDARLIVYLTNEYDASGRIAKQTSADTGIYIFDYTVAQTTKVTDPRNNRREVTFNSNGYALTDTLAVGQPERQTFTYDRDPVKNLVNSVTLTTVTDPIGLKTSYTYNAMGNVLTVTSLAGTPAAATTTYAYEPVFNQVESVTDPLTHKTSFSYYPDGSLKTVPAGPFSRPPG